MPNLWISHSLQDENETMCVCVLCVTFLIMMHCLNIYIYLHAYVLTNLPYFFSNDRRSDSV